MLSWNDYLARQQRNQDLLREAEIERWAHACMPGASNGPAHKAIAWLGQQMVDWGVRLQARTGAAPRADLSPADIAEMRALAALLVKRLSKPTPVK